MPSAITPPKFIDIRVVFANSGRRKLAACAELSVRKLAMVFQAASPGLTTADSLFVSSLFAMLALRLSAKDSESVTQADLAIRGLVSEVHTDTHNPITKPLLGAVAQHILTRSPITSVSNTVTSVSEEFEVQELSELKELLDVPANVSGLSVVASEIIEFLEQLDSEYTFADFPELSYVLTANSKNNSLLDSEDGLAETEVNTQIRDASSVTQIAEVKPDATSLGSSSLTSLAKRS